MAGAGVAGNIFVSSCRARSWESITFLVTAKDTLCYRLAALILTLVAAMLSIMFIMVRSFPPTGSWPEALAWLCHKNSIGERKEKIMQKFPMQSVNCMGNLLRGEVSPQ